MTQQRPGTGADSVPDFTAGIESRSMPMQLPDHPPRVQSNTAAQENTADVVNPTKTYAEPEENSVKYQLKYMLSPKFRDAEDKRIADAQRANDARIAHQKMLAEEELQRQAALKQQAKEDLTAYAEGLSEAIWRNGRQQTLTATVSHVKGGASKTTTTCYLASTLGAATTRLTTVIDNNEDWGTSGRLLGIAENETLTVRTTHAKKQEGAFQDFRSFSGSLGSTIHSVQLVAADALMQRDDLYGYETANEVIELVQNNSIFVVNDTGTHIAGQAMKAALDRTNVLIIPTITSGNSLAGARVTMQNYRAWGYSDLVKHAIVVVSGLMPGETAEDYREEMELSDSQTLLGVPYDDRIRKDYVVMLRDTPLLTSIAYLELALSTIMVHKHIVQHGLNSTPLKIEQGKVIGLPSGRTPVLPYAR